MGIKWHSQYHCAELNLMADQSKNYCSLWAKLLKLYTQKHESRYIQNVTNMDSSCALPSTAIYHMDTAPDYLTHVNKANLQHLATTEYHKGIYTHTQALKGNLSPSTSSSDRSTAVNATTLNATHRHCRWPTTGRIKVHGCYVYAVQGNTNAAQ